MKTKKTNFIVVLIVAFVAAISASAFLSLAPATTAKAADETTATITIGKARWCNLLDTSNPTTSRIGVAFDGNTWDSDFATTGNVTYKGQVEDLKGNKVNADLMIGAATDGKFRIDFKVPQNEDCRFVVPKTAEFTCTPAGGEPATVTFATSCIITYKVDGAPTIVAEKLTVTIGSGIYASPLNDTTASLSFNSTKTGHHTATGTYKGEAEDEKGNKVDLTVLWDSKIENKLILRFPLTTEILVIKQSMEFTIEKTVTGAPEKVSFDKDVYIVYVLGSSAITVGDYAKIGNMKTTTVSLGEGSYATDSNKDQANTRAFVSFIYCSWKGDFTLPTEVEMAKSNFVYVGGKVYDRDGKEYSTSVDIVVTLMPEKDRSEESTAAKQFRVYIKFPKTVNPVFIKAGTVFKRSTDVDGTPYKLVIDKDYIVTYELDSENVVFTPHLVTFEAKDGAYDGDSYYVEDESKISAPEGVTVPAGYRAEWLDENNEVFDFENSEITEDTTLRLNFIKQVTVTFDSDGGSKKNPITLDVNGKATKPADPIKPSDDEKTAYVLDGWYLEGSETAFDFENTAITEDITLKAKWTKQTVKVAVTFDSDGGTEISPILVAVNGKATKPADPEKTVEDKKYKFEGWYLEGAETAFDFANTAITEDTTLVARWSEVTADTGCGGSLASAFSLMSVFAVLAAAVVIKKKS